MSGRSWKGGRTIGQVPLPRSGSKGYHLLDPPPGGTREADRTAQPKQGGPSLSVRNTHRLAQASPAKVSSLKD